ARTTVRYRKLPGTLLVDVEVRRCGSCGKAKIPSSRIEQLDRLLVGVVASRPGRLTGPEIRFLREHLGWSAAYLAPVCGAVPPETVSRWETGEAVMCRHAEHLLRWSASPDWQERRPVEAGKHPAEHRIRWTDEGWVVA